MFFEASDKNISDIEADAIIMTTIYKDGFNINETDIKNKQLILDDSFQSTEEFIDFIKRIIEKNKDVFEKIIIVIIGKSFKLQDSEINNRVVNALKDQENDFLEFILKPYQHKLKKIIFQTSKDQYQDFKKKWSLITNWSIGKQLTFIIDSLDINNTQEAVCRDYHLNAARFEKYLKKFCNENRVYLENRNENILKEKYGEVICILPEKIAEFFEFFKNCEPTQTKNFINKTFPEIYPNFDQDLTELWDILWRLNIRMGAGKKKLFLYVTHLTPEEIIKNRNISAHYKKKRVENMIPEDIEEEVSTHYENLLNKVQKIKLFNTILDEKSGEPIFPINQLKEFWENFEEDLISKRPNNKTERIGIWEKIISKNHTAGDIIAELLSECYNKAPDTIKGYYQKKRSLIKLD